MPPTKKVDSDKCSYCDKTRQEEPFLTCSMCKIECCSGCSSVQDFIVTALAADPDCFPGFKWYCKSCQNLDTTWTSVTKKLESIDKDNKTRLNALEDRMQNLEESVPLLVEEEGAKIEKQILAKNDIKFNKLERDMETLVETNVNTINSDIKEIKSKYVTKDDFEKKMREFIDKKKSPIKQDAAGTSTSKIDTLSPNTRMKVTVMKSTQEMAEKNDKKNNLIIRNIEERVTNNIDERDALDKDYILGVIQDTLKVNIKPEDVVKNTRLGIKDVDRKRPVRLCLTNTDIKDKIMTKLYKLRNTAADNLSFAHDMTKLEQEEFRKLVDEAKKLENEDEDVGKKRFRVRGPPWKMQIVELPPLEDYNRENQNGMERTRRVEIVRKTVGEQDIKAAAKPGPAPKTGGSG